MTAPSGSQREAPIYNIKAVARLTAVHADTLRRWESRYNILTPRRTGTGYRVYSQRDVDTILWLKAKIEEGLSISRACDMLRQLGGDPNLLQRHAANANDVASPLLAPGHPQPTHPVEAANENCSFDALRAELMVAFRTVDEARATAVLSDALSLYTLEDVCLQLMQPVLVQMGEAWLNAEISVAVEHFAASFVRSRLANLFHSSAYNPHGALVLVACAPEEFHELGAMFLAVFLRRAGYRVVYLGQNVPVESLEGMIHAMHPEVVCISSTRAETASALLELREFLDNLKRDEGYAPLLAYGGQLFNRYPHISEHLGGVYIGEDAHEAIRMLGNCLPPTA